MKIDKVIVSCDNSHYQYYWPIIAKVCKKKIKEEVGTGTVPTQVILKLERENKPHLCFLERKGKKSSRYERKLNKRLVLFLR